MAILRKSVLLEMGANREQIFFHPRGKIAPIPHLEDDKQKERVEIISPMPLEDLQTIVHSMKKFKKDNKSPEGFEKLGTGHFGTVFGYKDFAIKFVSGGQDAYEGYGSYRGGNEIQDAQVLRKLQCIPSIPRLYATIDDEMVIMERVDGLTLKQYQDQMEDAEQMDNFINVDFIKDYKETIKDILMLGMKPSDLHMDNVMVCRKTGLARIIDVGLFGDMNEQELKKRGDNRDEAFFDDFYSSRDAIDYAERMRPYINEAKFPQLLEDRKADVLERREIRKRFKEKRDARYKLEREADEKRIPQRYLARGGVVGIDRGGLVEVDRADVVCGVVDIKPQINWWENDNQHFIPMPAPLHRLHAGARFENDIVYAKEKERPRNCAQLIAMKKDNQFKKGLAKMIKPRNMELNDFKIPQVQ